MFKMNGTKSKPMNRRALIGKLKHFDDGVRSLFEQATDSCQNLHQTYTGDALDLREIQTYPEWKVQMCFRNLRKHHRKRSRQSIIYILPLGPFPKILRMPIEHGSVSTFELIRRFVSCYFFGMTVKFLEEIAVTKVNCKHRFHPVTGKLQLLVTDLMRYLKTSLPADGYCIIGLTWVDLYPGEDWNFVLGESSCEDGCAVVSFGHFEPQSYQYKHLNDTTNQNIAGVQCDKADRTIFSVSFERNGHDDVSLYLEDFADIEKINKKIIWRLLRVSSHEICHVFGMAHCSYFACAMNESKSVLQAENQPLFLCPVCLRKLQKAVGFDVMERYTGLCILLEYVMNEILSKDEYCHTEDTSLQNTEECKFVMAISWLKSVLKFIKRNNDINSTSN